MKLVGGMQDRYGRCTAPQFYASVFAHDKRVSANIASVCNTSRDCNDFSNASGGQKQALPETKHALTFPFIDLRDRLHLYSDPCRLTLHCKVLDAANHRSADVEVRMWNWTVTWCRFLRDKRTCPRRWISRAAFLLPLTGGAGTVGLLVRSGPRCDSGIRLAFFAIWAISPFVALLLASAISTRWSLLTRVTIYGVMLMVILGSLAIYGNMVSPPLSSDVAFPFLIVPLGAWLLITIVVPAATLLSRRLPSFWPLRWLIKTFAVVVMSGAAGAIGLLGLLLWDHNRDTILPSPTGPFAVGRTSFVWSDAHVDSQAQQPGTRRELLAWIWYPASPGNGDPPADDYLPAAWRTAIEEQCGILITQFLKRDLSRVHSHLIRATELSSEQSSYPVVIMRTGGAALATEYTSLAADLASHGYVVVGFDVPDRSWVVVYPDGKVIARAPENNLDLTRGLQTDQLASKLAQAWAADAGFALDQLERLNTSDTTGRFRGRLDLQHVGVFGHSLGGATALLFCHDDIRCKAGIDLDGAPFGSVIADGVTQPFMFLLSDHRGELADAETPRAIRDADANIHRIYDRQPTDRRLHVVIRRASHYMFSDGAILKSPLVTGAMRALGILRLDGRRQIAVTTHCISTFFDVFLKGKPAFELKSLAESPELEILP